MITLDQVQLAIRATGRSLAGESFFGSTNSLLLLLQLKKWLSWWEGSARTRRTARWSSTSSWRWSPRRREKILNHKEMLFWRLSGLSVYVFKCIFINLHLGRLTKIVMGSWNQRSSLVFWPGTIRNCPTVFKRWSRSFKILTDSSCMKVDAESEICNFKLLCRSGSFLGGGGNWRSQRWLNVSKTSIEKKLEMLWYHLIILSIFDLFIHLKMQNLHGLLCILFTSCWICVFFSTKRMHV